MMRKIFIQLIVASCMVVPAFTQNRIEIEIRPDEPVINEVVLKGQNKFEELKIGLKVEWKSANNRLHLTLDRKNVSDNDSYLLFIPILQNGRPLKDIMDCKTEQKAMWSKTVKLDQQVNYFLKSDNLSPVEQFNCYLSLANNNDEEFAFDMKNTEDDFTLELADLYVAKTEKKGFFAKKKDKKILFKVMPVTLQFRTEKIVEVDVCCMEDIAIAYIELQRTILQTTSATLLDAQKKRNCTLFTTQMGIIQAAYTEVNDKLEPYKECEIVAPVLQSFNDACEALMKEECTAVVQPTVVCNMSESELTAINTSLRNLQMTINVKKKDGLSIADEQREYQSIKSSTTPKITAECRKRYADLINAYTNYCTAIERLF